MSKKSLTTRDFFPTLSLFDDFLKSFYEDETEQENLRLMPIDLIEHDDHYEVKANLPGFNKKDIKISLKDDELIIEATHSEKKEEKKGSYYRCERYSGNYRRSIALTEKCDADSIDAKYENGVLTISIPKKEPKPAKQIAIK